MEDLLPNKCQIMKQVETQGRYDPTNEKSVVAIDNVECRLDTLILTLRASATANDVSTPGRSGGTIFIMGNYGYGENRKFNESNQINLFGRLYDIVFIHDVFGSDELHHYEVQIERGINR